MSSLETPGSPRPAPGPVALRRRYPRPSCRPSGSAACARTDCACPIAFHSLAPARARSHMWFRNPDREIPAETMRRRGSLSGEPDRNVSNGRQDAGLHPEPPRGGGSDAHQVRLHRAGDQHRVGAARLSFAEVELDLAHLVAAEREAGAVVALDPEIDAKRPAKVRRGIERRRRMAEPRPREAGDAGKGTGHDGNRHVRWLLRGSVLACAQTGALAGRPMQADFAARGDNAAPRYWSRRRYHDLHCHGIGFLLGL